MQFVDEAPRNAGSIDQAISAIVLTGGRSRRFGANKARALFAGSSLFDIAMLGFAGYEIVVVGDPIDTDITRVKFVREEPPGAGPCAALCAGANAASNDVLAVVGVDMPFAAPVALRCATVLGVRGAEVDAVVACDPDGRDQLLCGAYRRESITRFADDLSTENLALRQLAAWLQIERHHLNTGDVSTHDIDTPEDLVRLERMLARPATKDTQMEQWVATAKQCLGIDTDFDVQQILDVARDVAHGVERPAAPVTTFLVGVAMGQGMTETDAVARVGDAIAKFDAK